MKFHTIISEFRNKLGSSEELNKTTTADIGEFYDTLNNFNFSFILFSKYHRKYIANLMRLKPDLEDSNPDLTLLRLALAENAWKPTTSFAIFIHHIKYENKITSKLFIAYQKKQNRKKLNAPAVKLIEVKNTKKSENWTRVPMPKHYSEK